MPYATSSASVEDPIKILGFILTCTSSFTNTHYRNFQYQFGSAISVTIMGQQLAGNFVGRRLRFKPFHVNGTPKVCSKKLNHQERLDWFGLVCAYHHALVASTGAPRCPKPKRAPLYRALSSPLKYFLPTGRTVRSSLLRVPNEGLLRPRVARAQRPHDCLAAPFPRQHCATWERKPLEQDFRSPSPS